MPVFAADLLFTRDAVVPQPIVRAEDGVVTQVSSRENRELPVGTKEFPGCALAPGYFDLHIHGGVGIDVMHASPAELAGFERFLGQHGVTSYLPTTLTAPIDMTVRALERLGNAVRDAKPEPGRARPAGIHLEGPFLSHAKRGVHPPEHLQAPDIGLFDRFFDAAGGAAKMMTVAPELAGADKFISHVVQRGVTVSIGHSDATWDQAQAGVRAGATTATHTFNAMRPLDHRGPGILGVVLTSEQLMADIIADGVHIRPEIVKLFLQLKTEERAILITDALSATGMPDGKYVLGGFEFEVIGDRCEHNGTLAGSVLTLDRAVRNAAAFAEWPLHRAARLASFNPAKLLGLETKGRIEPGADADMVVLDPGGNVRATIIAGLLA
jgi:N-acetylglucosamine-6-phosphate deacetylase